MTAVIAPDRVANPLGASTRRIRVRRVVAGAALALAFLVWALPLTHGSGGREPWVLALGVLSLLPALLIVRPWRSLPGWEVAVALGPAAAAVVVCLTAPTQWDGLDETVSLAYAGGLYLVIRTSARDRRIRDVGLVAVAIVGFEQFTQAYLPWWGGGTVSRLMVGTFYWHNQFAAFTLGTGLVAAVLAVRGKGPLRLTGWLVAPWCVPALLFAGSRASLAIFAVVWLVVIILAFRDRRGRLACFGVLGAGLVVATVLSSPMLMDDSGWATSTVQAREAAESTEGNGRARLLMWRAAVDLGLDHPFTGAGFDSFGSAGSARMPVGSGLSAFVHNGYLQAFSDGGTLLLVAVTVATGLPLAAGLRLMMSSRSRRGDEVAAIGVPAALLALIVHSGVDFDWLYPSLLGLFAILAALLPATRPVTSRRTQGEGGRRYPVASSLVVCGLVLIAMAGGLRASGLKTPSADPPWWASPTSAVVPLSGAVEWLPAAQECRRAMLTNDAAIQVSGFRCSARAAEDDPQLQLLRAHTDVVLGNKQRGVRAARAVIRDHGAARPTLRIGLAAVYEAAGWDSRARVELLALRAELVDRGMPTTPVDDFVDSAG